MGGRKASGSELLATLGALAVLVATAASQSELAASLWTRPVPSGQRGAGCSVLGGIGALEGEGDVHARCMRWRHCREGHCPLLPLQMAQTTPLQKAGASMVRALACV